MAQECGSTDILLTMHYCAAVVLEARAPPEVRRQAATGGQLATLAFSEAGSRSHFFI
ncbi:MAG: hypothetical protein ACKV22_15765 [Bryobacteraceae bacterium]